MSKKNIKHYLNACISNYFQFKYRQTKGDIIIDTKEQTFLNLEIAI